MHARMTRDQVKKIKNIILGPDTTSIGPDRNNFKERLLKSIAKISANQYVKRRVNQAPQPYEMETQKVEDKTLEVVQAYRETSEAREQELSMFDEIEASIPAVET